jgi:hypothetical protein
MNPFKQILLFFIILITFPWVFLLFIKYLGIVKNFVFG